LRCRLHRSTPALALALIATSACSGGSDGPSPVFADVQTRTASLAAAAGPIELTVARIPEGALPDSTVPMWLGRFIEAFDYTGERRVMVLSYEVWELLGGDPAVIGTEHDVDGVTHVLLGIAPRGWADPPGANAWIPQR
jgi:hypothetical protein